MKALGLAAILLAACSAPALAQGSAAPKTATAIFAGGCFWCMEPPFDKLDGVISTISGYTAGQTENPTYEQVSAGRTGHTEAVKITYDPAKISYDKLLVVFWHNHDPLTAKGQFCDIGSQYRPGIYYANDEERRLAEQSKAQIAQARLKQPIATEILPASAFYPAEDYHQDYYMKNPVRYKFYRTGCGRDRRLKELWGEDASE